MLRALYILFALAVIGGYGYAAFGGRELTRPRQAFTPQGPKQQSMRGAHGGARSFWYGGYRGGK
jgi:hypothetical protein